MEPRYHKNADGPFYVVDQECISCGAPEAVADGLIVHDSEGEHDHCYFAREPKTLAEVDAAIRAIHASCCGALRYGGHDLDVLRRLGESGEAFACDYPLEPEPGIRLRNAARFRHVAPRFFGRKSFVEKLGRALADGLSEYPTARTKSMRVRRSYATFQYVWNGVQEPCRATIHLDLRRGCGTVRVLDNWIASLSIATTLSQALDEFPGVSEVEWLSDWELDVPGSRGVRTPY